ncbi:hypothetical protein CU097_014199, partial [Rhizopus azygosporus]
MEIDYKLPVLIFVSYFTLLIPALFWIISPQLKRSFDQHSTETTLLFVLTGVFTTITWIFVCKFMYLDYTIWSFSKGFHWDFSLNAISHWLHDVCLFEDVVREASTGAWSWLWTHQIATFEVIVWTTILTIEGWRRRIPHLWAYMLLCKAMGVSTAMGVFCVVMLSHPPIRRRPSPKLLGVLVFSITVGLITVLITPYISTSSNFMTNLVIMHAVALLPLIGDYDEQPALTIYDGTPKFITLLYCFIAGANFSIYLQQWIKCFMTCTDSKHILCRVVSTYIDVFWEHPAQTVVNLDNIGTSVMSVVWIWLYSQQEFKKR